MKIRVKSKICPVCNSKNCEESEVRVVKGTAHFYPVGIIKVSCYLCYNCGASETSFNVRKR